jgi:hypothetical protein
MRSRARRTRLTPKLAGSVKIHAIARAQNTLAVGVPNGEGKHAVDSCNHGIAPLPIRVEQYFGVRPSAKLGASRAKLAAQFDKVVYFTVEHDELLAVLATHRLVTRLGKVNDLQARVDQKQVVGAEYTLAVRAAVTQGAQDGIGIDRLVRGERFTEDATH